MRGSVTQSCVAALEGSGVTSTQDAPIQRLRTCFLLQASAGVESNDVCEGKPWQE